jgi:DNA-binding MarR family transcriptional regulator
MSDLAGKTNASLSRLSHVVTKLEKRGFVSRCPSPVSRRVTLVKLTDDGWDVLVKAAPGHVETVRSLVFDGLGADDVAALEKIAGHIVDRIEASKLDSTC